jgi:L-ascorbate metabolism protein UlaG (beta-lactamase superfamily)
MGDTGLFGDMKFIAEYYKPDLVLIPIGGNFTMGPVEAAYAIKTWIKPKMVMPIHYNSNPIAKGTLAQFEEAMKAGGGMGDIKIIAPKEGETVKF